MLLCLVLERGRGWGLVGPLTSGAACRATGEGFAARFRELWTLGLWRGRSRKGAACCCPGSLRLRLASGVPQSFHLAPGPVRPVCYSSGCPRSPCTWGPAEGPGLLGRGHGLGFGDGGSAPVGLRPGDCGQSSPCLGGPQFPRCQGEGPSDASAGSACPPLSSSSLRRGKGVCHCVYRPRF
ncbi:hypothetical protein HJG60_008466 [Phyllostomus discolor]|uniref:Uncharacterized protein n=1 Tax=Phyllostomus discolor TaxID=89673 RepID=A0A834DMA0_9CHIR|nr:hypothetical protein HJG60_008466 [Phyllostomus discolor]